MIVRLILLTAVNMPLVQSYLDGLGVKARYEVLDLSRANLADRLQFHHTAKKAFLGKKAKYTIVIREPFINEQGNEVLLGDASKGFATVVWNDFNSAGEDRQIHSLVALAHELAHVIGNLPHTKGCISIMDEAAMACPNVKELRFTVSELQKINRHLS